MNKWISLYVAKFVTKKYISQRKNELFLLLNKKQDLKMDLTSRHKTDNFLMIQYFLFYCTRLRLSTKVQKEIYFDNFFNLRNILSKSMFTHRDRCTGTPRYSRTFYRRIRWWINVKLTERAKKNFSQNVFFCKFSIQGPKLRDLSTSANIKVHLYWYFVSKLV